MSHSQYIVCEYATMWYTTLSGIMLCAARTRHINIIFWKNTHTHSDMHNNRTNTRTDTQAHLRLEERIFICMCILALQPKFIYTRIHTTASSLLHSLPIRWLLLLYMFIHIQNVYTIYLYIIIITIVLQ